MIACLFLQCSEKNKTVLEDKTTITISKNDLNFVVEKTGFRYSIQNKNGAIIAPPHKISGLQIGKTNDELFNVTTTRLVESTDDQTKFEVKIGNGDITIVVLKWLDNSIKLSVEPQESGKFDIVLRTGSLGPAYGLADDNPAINKNKAKGADLNLEIKDFDSEPYNNPRFKSGLQRMTSNFIIFPQQGLAEVNIDPTQAIVKINENENAQGSKDVENLPAFYYFTGTPKEIYKTYLIARRNEGFQIDKPKYAWFGVGWEAFGALAWDTNEKTVTQNINQYLERGYPLKWMVVGSGFWPSSHGEFNKHGSPVASGSNSDSIKKLQATTSFGMWDKKKYPDPKAFIDYFHNKGLIFIIGLRIGFIPGGPFTDEGLQKGYFIKDNKGKQSPIKTGFPKVATYLLDAQNEKAVEWYVALCDKWLDYGVDGFKEDLFGQPSYLREDLVDPINKILMNKGVYVMGRNNYLGSPVDIHRYNDFNFNQSQDRGPINGLSYAFSGFPYVYPDIVGGTGLATDRWGDDLKEKARIYLIRYAQYGALNPSMSFGNAPWNYGQEANKLSLKAAKLHARLHPYIYSNAIKAYHTGFPYTMVPLPLAYPEDKNVYGLANTDRRSYEWMIGEALLAAPLYGDDYATSFSRNIYLPEGKWIDYNSGKEYTGPVTLDNFQIPIEKSPLFVGGTGIIIEEIDGQLKGRIYPISQKSKMVFYAKDGETQNTITIDNPNWNNIKIIDETNNQDVSYSKVRHAFQFNFTEGHNYSIK